MEPFNKDLILPQELVESLTLVIKRQNVQLHKKMKQLTKKK